MNEMKTRSSEEGTQQEMQAVSGTVPTQPDDAASGKETNSSKEVSSSPGYHSKEALGSPDHRSKEASISPGHHSKEASSTTSSPSRHSKEASSSPGHHSKEASSSPGHHTKETSSSPGHHSKKSKKHKHKKHKKKRESSLSSHDPAPQFTSEFDSSSQLKLKIKFDGATFATKSVARSSVTDLEPLVDEPVEDQDEPMAEEESVWQDDVIGPPQLQNAGKVDEEEEEAWLKALEAGELDDNGEIKKEKDLTSLTARQRALLQMKGDEDQPLWELPTSQKAAVLTEEGIQKKALRAQRRRDQAQKKDLENKKQTIERLLKKQEVKSKLLKSKSKQKLVGIPRMQYINNIRGVTLSLPAEMDFPLQPQRARSPPPLKLCGITGCTNPKKYCCSKTGMPLCSLQCYKKNLQAGPVPAQAMVT